MQKFDYFTSPIRKGKYISEPRPVFHLKHQKVLFKSIQQANCKAVVGKYDDHLSTITFPTIKI